MIATSSNVGDGMFTKASSVTLRSTWSVLPRGLYTGASAFGDAYASCIVRNTDRVDDRSTGRQGHNRRAHRRRSGGTVYASTKRVGNVPAKTGLPLTSKNGTLSSPGGAAARIETRQRDDDFACEMRPPGTTTVGIRSPSSKSPALLASRLRRTTGGSNT
jgi:hypothetical protein